MSDASHKSSDFLGGIIDFGAFWQLMAEHLRTHFPILVFDAAPDAARADATGARIVPFEAMSRPHA